MTTLQTAFDHLPRTARNHFQVCFYAAVYRLVLYLYRLASSTGGNPRDALEAHPFLGRYFEEMLAYLPEDLSWDEASSWWGDQIAAWEAHAEVHLPLRELLASRLLSANERDGLMLAGLIEEDSRFGTLFAELQAPQAQRRPCLELVELIAAAQPPDGQPVTRSLIDKGFVEVTSPEAPRSEWQLRVPSLVWDAVRGEAAALPSWLQQRDAADAPSADQLLVSPAFAAQLGRLPELLRNGTAKAIVLRGMRGSDRLEYLANVAKALDRGLAIADLSEPAAEKSMQWSVLGPYCSITRRLPVMIYDPGPGEVAEPPALRGYEGPLAIVLGHEGGLAGTTADSAVTLSLPFPNLDQRRRHWQAGLKGHEVAGLEEISDRFLLAPGHIRAAARMAVAYSQLAQRDAVLPTDVAAACRQLNRQHLDTLAARVETDGRWQDLVLDDSTAAQLADLEKRCRNRERVLSQLGRGFRTSSSRGVKALFSGASGTGKTLAARVLAGELGMDLYRVDLGAVVNKYVGETEKNLHRVLSWAEELDVILLLDEGDSVLGNRTEVKSANDRYANLETNYLLQRLESYQGIVFITTNAARYIDNAFQRRMDVVINFVPPQAFERLQVWRMHLPASTALEDDYLTQLSQRFVMTGGQIRNAAMHATMLAVSESHGVQRHHVEQAIQSEYRKAGALGPSNDTEPSGPATSTVNTLMRALA